VSTIGELSDISVIDLIEIFARRGRSGRLVVKTGGQEIHLYFDQGRLALITSTDITIRLGRMLIRQGLLETPQLLEALHAQSESGNRKPLGAILIERGWVTSADLARCVEEQSIEALARAIEPDQGLFVFEAGVSRPGHVEAIPLDPKSLLKAAKERTEALRVLRGQLPPPSTPFSLHGGAMDAAAAAGSLGNPESVVIGALRSGPKTYEELGFHVALDELTLGVAVLTLLEQGLIASGGASANGRAGWKPATD
jgi:hypothetical protein